MASRRFNQFQYSAEQDRVILHGKFSIGASGAVTANSVKGGGITSVTKSATAGQYVITLSDKYAYMFDFNTMLVGAAGASSGVAKTEILGTPATFQADTASAGTITIQMLDYAGAAVNATSGTICWFTITTRNSNVNPFGM